MRLRKTVVNLNAGFSAHHTAPLYFDYINNPQSGFANKRTLRDNTLSNGLISDIRHAIAKSKYWKDSIIVVTWDDGGGFYDHVPPPGFGQTCPQDRSGPEQGCPCGDGVRLPALVISPFAKTGVVVHDFADHGSVSKLIEAIFGLPAFASLPDEAKGRFGRIVSGRR